MLAQLVMTKHEISPLDWRSQEKKSNKYYATLDN